MSVRLRFDFTGEGRAGPTPRLFIAPLEIIAATRIEDVLPAMVRADRALADGRWIAGFVSYEAAPAFDDALTTRQPGPCPLVWFGVFEGPSKAAPLTHPLRPTPDSRAWTPDVDRAEYDDAVRRVREAILEGDVYQANYTFRLRSEAPDTDGLDQYAALAAAARPPYAACLDLGRWQILSLSPELFFERHGHALTTRPMKGTMPRGRYPQEDEAHRATLATSAKDRAENVMIVDLMRNDLARLATTGTVKVPALFEVERYPTVFQMTSTVTSRMRPGVGLLEIFSALFPAGSVTGAPKSSSMRLLSTIERAPRGVYCGAIGFAGPDDTAIFNVAIRTATIDRETRTIELGIGGGVTWDSSPDGEYDEAFAKARAFTPMPPFSLVETMRLERGTFLRRDRHLARLERSAWFFDIACDTSGIESALDRCASTHSSGAWRVRLLVGPSGSPTVEATSLGERLLPARRPVRLARTPISSNDVWLFHKTTHRDVYDQQRASSSDVFDALLWNERGEITEFTIGNVVVDLDGRRLTPPVDCGLLAGVYREVLLETGAVEEDVITRGDLYRATRIWLINSVREWVEVSLLTES